ncbi:MAG TPA: transglutaminase domain-containing protein [Anaerolineales bacterium]|nr:transglutaminase domain-containing protein [Anaerolineales bacterium]
MIPRIRNWLARDLIWYRLTVYLLFLWVMMLLVANVVQIDRGLHAASLYLTVLLASIFNLLFTLMKKDRTALLVIFSLAGSVVTAYTIIGNLFLPALRYLQNGASYLFSLLGYYLPGEEKTLPDQGLVQQQWQSLNQAIAVLSGRLQSWLGALPEPVYDPVSLNLVWSIALWLTAVWFFWFAARRKQAIIGILPPLLILANVYQTTNSGLGALFFVTAAGVLLAVQAHQAQQEDFWQRKNFTISGVSRRTAAEYSLSLAIGLVVFASIVSSPRLDDLIRDIREQRQKSAQGDSGTGGENGGNQDNNSFFGPEEVLSQASDGWMPNVHLIGSSPELAEIEVFRAQIQDPNAQYASNYYFRAATYETYTLEGWQTIGKEFIFTPPEETFEIDFTQNEQLMYQQVTFVDYSTRGNLMVAIGELAATDVSSYSAYHTAFVNNTYADLFASVTRENRYIAYSIVPYYTEKELRSATTNYPSWITNKYLQVPDSVPDRVYDLALDLTATQPSQYDRALAIEQYLRGFTYNLEIEAPPTRQDIVDYFLFDLQEGYCDYYASSMVVLARAAGIPARLATGYFVNAYDPELDIFIATADRAHSWVEVYFPSYGWVTFEPTAGRPVMERPEERDIRPDLETALLEDGQTAGQDQLLEPATWLPSRFFLLVVGIFLAAFLVLLAYNYIDRWILASMASNRLFARLYQRLRRHANRIGIRIQDTDTPLEFTDSLNDTFNRLKENPTFNRWFGSIPLSAGRVITACSQAAYTNHTPEEEEINLLIAEWGRLRWQLILIQLFLRVRPFITSLESIWYRMQQPA